MASAIASPCEREPRATGQTTMSSFKPEAVTLNESRRLKDLGFKPRFFATLRMTCFKNIGFETAFNQSPDQGALT